MCFKNCIHNFINTSVIKMRDRVRNRASERETGGVRDRQVKRDRQI